MILDGLKEASLIEGHLRSSVTSLKKRGINPKLGIVLVGNSAASCLYVKKKQKKAEDLGISSTLVHLKKETDQLILADHIKKLNHRSDIHGILLQLPLPAHLNAFEALSHICPTKDLDGLTPYSVGLLSMGKPYFVPCTPQGCLHLIHLWKKNIAGLHATVIGRSMLVGKPIAQLLLQQNCTVTLAHSHTKDLQNTCHHSDILVVATGQKHLVKKDWVKKGACIIDVGINPLRQSVTGDVDFQDVKGKAGAISPVPGGVGPLTVIFLMSNLIKAAEHHA